MNELERDAEKLFVAARYVLDKLIVDAAKAVDAPQVVKDAAAKIAAKTAQTEAAEALAK